MQTREAASLRSGRVKKKRKKEKLPSIDSLRRRDAPRNALGCVSPYTRVHAWRKPTMLSLDRAGTGWTIKMLISSPRHARVSTFSRVNRRNSAARFPHRGRITSMYRGSYIAAARKSAATQQMYGYRCFRHKLRTFHQEIIKKKPTWIWLYFLGLHAGSQLTGKFSFAIVECKSVYFQI